MRARFVRESRPDLPGRGGDTTQCRRPRPGKDLGRAVDALGGGGTSRRWSGGEATAEEETAEYSRRMTVARLASYGACEPGRTGAPGAVEPETGCLSEGLCMCMVHSVVTTTAPSRGGVLKLRGNPVHGAKINK